MAESRELVSQWQYRVAHTCSNCKKTVETRYHCTMCGEVDMCFACHEKESLVHKMEKLGFGLDGRSTARDRPEANFQGPRSHAVERCVTSLVHASHCTDTNCRSKQCQRIKRIVQFARSCKCKAKLDCCVCKHLITLTCSHAKHCQDVKCPVPFCTTIRRNIKNRPLQQTIEIALSSKRRAAAMQNRSMSGAVLRSRPGNSSSSSERYPRAQQHSSSSSYPSETGFGIIPSRAPPVGGLQSVQQASAAEQVDYYTALQEVLCVYNNTPFWIQNHQPHQNPTPLSPADMRQTTNLGEGSGTVTSSVGNSATGSYPRVMRNSGPSRGGAVEEWQQL